MWHYLKTLIGSPMSSSLLVFEELWTTCTRLPRSMPNADQCRPKFWHWSQCWSIPIGIDRHWEELIGNDRHWEALWINAMILIAIDRHWAPIEGVLHVIACYPWMMVFYLFLVAVFVQSMFSRTCCTPHPLIDMGSSILQKGYPTVSLIENKWVTSHQKTRFMLRSAVGMTHGLRSDLWWTKPLRILLGQEGWSLRH